MLRTAWEKTLDDRVIFFLLTNFETNLHPIYVLKT